jgi:hypothetical protein
MPKKKEEPNAAEVAAAQREKARATQPGMPLEGDELEVVKEILETQAVCGKEGCGGKAKIQVLKGNPDKMKYQAVRMACAKEPAQDGKRCDWVSQPFQAIGLFCVKCGKSTLHGIPGAFFEDKYVCLSCNTQTPKEQIEHEDDKVSVVNPSE